MALQQRLELEQNVLRLIQHHHTSIYSAINIFLINNKEIIIYKTEQQDITSSLT